MESFTLGPTPKIDFSFSTTTAHNGTQQQRLESERISTTTPKINSLSSMEFNTEFLQITCLEASIYILQKLKSCLIRYS
jgi:hypothetical protein